MEDGSHLTMGRLGKSEGAAAYRLVRETKKHSDAHTSRPELYGEVVAR